MTAVTDVPAGGSARFGADAQALVSIAAAVTAIIVLVESTAAYPPPVAFG